MLKRRSARSHMRPWIATVTAYARVDKGYKRRADGMLKHRCRHRFRVWISGQAPIASVSPGSVECVCLFEQPHGLRGVVATLL